MENAKNRINQDRTKTRFIGAKDATPSEIVEFKQWLRGLNTPF